MVIDLVNANLTNAYIDFADLRNSYLSRANLTGAVLYNSNLSNSDLSWSDITDVQLNSVDLKYVRAFGLTGCVDWNLPTHLQCTNDGLTQFETSSIVGPYVNLSNVDLSIMPTGNLCRLE